MNLFPLLLRWFCFLLSLLLPREEALPLPTWSTFLFPIRAPPPPSHIAAEKRQHFLQAWGLREGFTPQVLPVAPPTELQNCNPKPSAQPLPRGYLEAISGKAPLTCGLARKRRRGTAVLAAPLMPLGQGSLGGRWDQKAKRAREWRGFLWLSPLRGSPGLHLPKHRKSEEQVPMPRKGVYGGVGGL